MYVPNNNKKSDMVEGSISENSTFHDTHGYYAQAIDETTCTLPQGWQERLILICNENTNYVKGWCLETHDLMISKLAAFREKDIEYFDATVKLKPLNKDTLLERLAATHSLSTDMKEKISLLVNSKIKTELKNEPTKRRR